MSSGAAPCDVVVDRDLLEVAVGLVVLDEVNRRVYHVAHPSQRPPLGPVPDDANSLTGEGFPDEPRYDQPILSGLAGPMC